MVATLTTHDMASSNARVIATGAENEEQQIDLRELTHRPGPCRGVTPHASDWLSCLERRGSSYLPI